jgi:hypothetical protein
MQDSSDSINSEMISDDEDPGICTELYAEDASRAFGSKNVFWTKNKLRVRFLGGSSYVQSKIRQYANVWSNHANITFEFVDNEPSDIRISFDKNDGSWSYIGRTNSYISANLPTMNFGWFTDRTSDSEFRRTTLHEFGHALGLAHEHQHPQASINWNRTAVYDYYQRTQGWSKSDVDNNIFQKYSANNSNYTEYDPKSVMHYYIPRSLVLGNWNPTFNTNLSDLDIQFVGKMYPGNNTDDGNDLSCHCPDTLSILSCDDFETYEQTEYENAANWSLWSSTSGFGELQTYTWGKVLKVAYRAVENPDIIYRPDNLNTDQFQINWDMYVGSESSAYFNIQKFATPGQEFGAQFYFNTDQTGHIEINNQKVDFVYRQNGWNKLSLGMDFKSNLASFRLNGEVVATWPAGWTAQSANGFEKFHALNFYAIDENAKFWLDDFCVSENFGSIVAANTANF